MFKFAVINEGGVLVADNDSQVSTNFNVCSTDESEGAFCWRYRIAKETLSKREVSLQTIRDILNATQQPQVVGTIYSNVINLTTGDAYNYYAGDFEHAYHFNLNNLLRNGKKSYLWRSLFPEAAVVRIWETYLSKGPDAALEWYHQMEARIPLERRPEILRHAFSCLLLRENRYADAKMFFDEWLRVSGGKDSMTNLYRGAIDLTTGNLEQAEQHFVAQVAVDESCKDDQHWRPSLAKELLDRLKGKSPRGANTRFELKGHREARFVCVLVLDAIPIRKFLLRTEDGWAAEFALPPGKLSYAFLVDGRVVLDPANPVKAEIDTVNGRRTRNVITVK